MRRDEADAHWAVRPAGPFNENHGWGPQCRRAEGPRPTRPNGVTPRVDGPRGCRPEELPGVIRLVDAAMRQGWDQTMRTDYPLVYAPGNLANVQVITVDDRVVATAPVLPRRVAGPGIGFGLGVISPTATDPAHQHRGHGRACVAACVARMGALGLELSVLWTQVATFPFYEHNGWQAVAPSGGAHRLSAADAARFERPPGTIATLATHPDRLAGVVRLHDAVRPGVTRSLAEAAALWFLPRLTTWLALDGERLCGYLVDSQAGNKPGILEAAGGAECVSGLVRHVLERLPDGATVDLHIGLTPGGLADTVQRALPGRTPGPLGGDMMVRINDPEAFLRGILGWLGAALPARVPRESVSVGVVDADAIVSFAWTATSGLAIGSERQPGHVELTRRELTSVLFGSHPERPVDIPDALAWLPRITLPIPVLDRS